MEHLNNNKTILLIVRRNDLKLNENSVKPDILSNEERIELMCNGTSEQ
jgi:hypothetical protein